MADPVNKVIDMIPMPGPSTHLAAIGSVVYATSVTAVGVTKVKTATKEVESVVASGTGAVVMLDFHRTIPIPDTIVEGSPDRRIYVVANSATADQIIEIIPGRFDTIAMRDIDPARGLFDLAASPTQRLLYFAGFGSESIGVFDPDRASTVASIPLGAEPQTVVVSRDGRRIYAGCPSSDAIVEVDATLDPPQVTRKLRLLGDPQEMAITPDGKSLVFGRIFATTVGIYDIESQTVRNVGVGREPLHVAVNASGTRAYTSNRESSTVCVVDLTLDQPRTIDTIFGFAKPRGMCFSEDGSRLYVANEGPDGAGQHSISVAAVEH